MNDSNNKKEASPFNQDPFSVDVWERAYKNVGRPFEKKAFESFQDENSEVNISPLPTKNLSNDKEANKKLLEAKKKELQERLEKRKAEEAAKSARPTVTPPGQLYSYGNQKTAYTYSPKQNSDTEEQKNESFDFFEMIENVFDGDVADVFKNISNLVKNSFGGNGKKKGNPTGWIWIAAVILFIIFGLLGNG